MSICGGTIIIDKYNYPDGLMKEKQIDFNPLH